MKRRRLIVAFLSVAASFGWLSEGSSWAKDDKASSAPQKHAAESLPSLSVTQYTLENGFTVMLSRDPSIPSVAAHIVYLVGSGHEEKGRTGFAHLFEHLMFQGSAHFDDEYFAPFEPIGARTNGTTSSDRTVYYEEIPSHYMELALWMESDRMRSLLPVLTQQKLDNQREVVKNERRQRYEVTPYGMSWWHMDHALYPVGHPYHHATIGSHEDLTAATLDDVRAFFLKYYVPKNAALSLVGDFEESEARALIEKYFGDMTPGKTAPTPSAQRPVISSPKHWVIEDEVALPRVYFAWITPALFESGDAELDLLSNVLTEGKSSRLFQSLVYERKLAKDIHAFQISQKLNGVYVIQSTAAPGTNIDELAAAVQEELKEALGKPPTESELRRAKNSYKKDFFDRLQTYSSRASLLGTYFLHTGKGDYVREDYERYVKASDLEVQKAGQAYLTEQSFVRLDFVPGKKGTPVRKLESQSKKTPITQKEASEK